MRASTAGTLVRGFAPILGPDPCVLVLGTAPGGESLRVGQYYAQSRNVFWRIFSDLLGFDPVAPYDERVRALTQRRIALWDVLGTCTRKGSLDAKIGKVGQSANDFAAFFQQQRSIKRVYFNGATPEELFRRHRGHSMVSLPVCFARLPSTSAAYAAMPYSEKLAAWRVVAEPCGQR